MTDSGFRLKAGMTRAMQLREHEKDSPAPMMTTGAGADDE